MFVLIVGDLNTDSMPDSSVNMSCEFVCVPIYTDLLIMRAFLGV